MKNGMNGQGRGGVMQGVFSVKRKEYLTPHYIRIVLEGADLENFEDAQVGDNNKIAIPNEHTDFSNMVGRPEGIVRTYTLRQIDLDQGEMMVDFVGHGEEGPASKWAINAKTGDQLAVFMKQKNKQLYKPADWYLLVGDHTAVPVISVILEQLPANAAGKAILEVYSEEDVLDLKHPEGVEIEWVFNNKPGEQVVLPARFQEQEIPEVGTRFIFSAAEYQSVKDIQEQIRAKEFITRDEWQSFSYWKYGMAESDSGDRRRELTHR